MAALHALLLLGAWRLQAWQDRGPPAPEQAPLIVWLQGAPRPRAMPAQPVPTPRLPLPVVPVVPVVPAVPVPRIARASPQAITPPVATPLPALAEASAVPASQSAAAPLNLALPGRNRAAPAAGYDERNPALDDPRSNTPKPTLESRIVAALGGSDQITEYRLEDGSLRLKRGNSCVVVRPNRDGVLDPYNNSTRQRLRVLDSC